MFPTKPFAKVPLFVVTSLYHSKRPFYYKDITTKRGTFPLLLKMLIAMGWHGVTDATPGQQGASFLPPLDIFLQFYIVAIS